MVRAMMAVFGSVLALGLMLVAFYAWFDAVAWIASTDRPRTLQWATRCLAVAAAAGAQVVLLTLVARRSRGTSGLRIAASLICCLAAVSAAAFGLAARE